MPPHRGTQMKELIIFEKKETLAEGLASDIATFGLLLLCMFASWELGGGWWTVVCTAMFLVSLYAKVKVAAQARWVKLSSKREAVAWANALPDDNPP